MSSRKPNDPYRELFERSADAILIIDGDRFVDCNQAAVDMLRARSKEEVLRTHPSALSPERQPDGRLSYEKANAMMAMAFERGSHRFEWSHMRADGEVFPVEVLLTVVPRGNGQRVLHTVWRDISERRRLEAQLRQSQKMEALGSLAGGIAHDFNNLLVAINGYAELLGRRLDRAEDRAAAEQILKAGERAAGLVRQLMTFSRKQDVSPQVVDLGRALDDVEQLLGRVIGEEIDLVVETPSPSPRVLIDPIQLEQVVVNLVANARDAMPGGGTIALRVAEVDGVPEGLPPGSFVVLEVRDRGEGMDEETARRAFDPFYTTKPLGRGTGLGLATVYGIASQAGGLVHLESGVGGTTVRVVLPKSSAPATYPSEPLERQALGGSEIIMLVEDDEAVASLVLRVLRRAGYRVLSAVDGEQAIEVFEREVAQQIDLLLTDVIMPHMGGAQLVRSLRERGHYPAVLFMSGYTAERLEGMADEDIDLLRKPFTATELLDRVRGALARGQAG